MKLRDHEQLKKLLPEKRKTIRFDKTRCPTDKPWNDCIDTIGAKEVEIRVCENCNGAGWYPQQVSDTEQEQRQCDCENGVIIEVKD